MLASFKLVIIPALLFVWVYTMISIAILKQHLKYSSIQTNEKVVRD